MKNLFFLLVLLVLVNYTCFSQEEIVCPWVTTIFKIQQESDIPNITTNSDGTLTIAHPTNQNITNIFSNYDVTVLERVFPTSQSPELIKAYTLAANSRQIFADLRDNVSEAIYSDFDFIGPDTLINSDFINLVDGNEYRLSAAISTSDVDPCSVNCDPEPLEDDLNIIIGFTYNSDEDLLKIETTQNTSCDNSFSINLSGGADLGDPNFDGFHLQTWSVNSATINTQDFNDSCFEPEYILYNFLQMICDPFAENLRVENINSNGIFQFAKANPFFGEERIEFRDVTLSVPENKLMGIYIYELKDSSYLQVHNPRNESLTAQIFDLTGKEIVAKTSTTQDLFISQLPSNAIYIVKLESDTGKAKNYKFLKM